LPSARTYWVRAIYYQHKLSR